MEPSDKPPLGAEVYESIATDQYGIDKKYWEQLSGLLCDSELMQSMMGRGPASPRQPIRLCRVLSEYACDSFDAEAKYYPDDDPRLDGWFKDLALRIATQTICSSLLIGKGRGGRLTYHATREQMDAAIRESLRKHLSDRLTDLRSDIKTALVQPNRPILASNDTERDFAEERKRKRTSIILPLLRKQGFTRSKWATEAGVDPCVIYDFLAGKSTPRPDSRKAMAEVLGLAEEELPD